MRKIFCLSLLVCLLGGGLTGCSKEAEVYKNKIQPKTLTQDQEEIVDLLSDNQQEILLFEYKTEEAYKSLEFWVEVYSGGTLVGRPSGVSLQDSEAKPLVGQLAVKICHDAGTGYTFTVSQDGARSSHTGIAAPADEEPFARGYGPVDTPVEIEAGKEFILYTSIYSNGNISSYSDMQRYVEEPELLRDYPYVHLIKCRFE